MTTTRRLSHAISDGEGIALIVDVDGPDAARAAEQSGAEAVLLTSGLEGRLEETRAATTLPILFVHDGQRSAALGGADACVVFGDLDLLDHWHHELGDDFELAIRVDHEEQLAEVLERFDPELLVLAAHDVDEPLEHVLELLSDVPAGKLAIAELAGVTRDEIDALERAGVDAVLLREPLPARASLLALGGLLALAAALRLPGLAYGLPFPLLNPDERSIVPRAWELVHGGGLDPGWYDYPSLLLVVLAPFQLPFDEPSYGAARPAAAVIGLAGVAAAWWLGRSAYGATAGVLAAAACAVSTVHVVYSHMAVTDVLLTTGVTVSLALLLTGRIEWAGVAAGLAASAKYPGVLLALPILLVSWREWRRLVLAALGAALAFLLTSPFVVIHAGAAWEDVSRVQRLARAGWLGFEDDPATPLAFLGRLWDALGPFLLVALAGLALALRALVLEQHKLGRRGRGTAAASSSPQTGRELVLEQHKLADLALASFALVYFAQLLTVNAHFDRYVLPLVPVLGVLAGRLPRLAPFALALLVVPLVWSVGEVRKLTRTDTRIVAHAWIQQNTPPDALVAAESSTPPLEPRRTIGLELPGPGRDADPNRDLARLRERGTDYVLVTGAVADRVLAAADNYPREAAFYGELESAAERVLLVSPGGDLAGPWVALYRL